jgi:hypothetical protein
MAVVELCSSSHLISSHLIPLLATSVATSKRTWLLTSLASVAIAYVRKAGVRSDGLCRGFEGKAGREGPPELEL